jgi:muramidase (phage lysozyme)
MARWFRDRRRGKNDPMREIQPVRVRDALRGLEGKWVAMRGDEVVRAAWTFDALYQELREHHIRDASVLRVPGEHEPEPVGIG